MIRVLSIFPTWEKWQKSDFENFFVEKNLFSFFIVCNIDSNNKGKWFKKNFIVLFQNWLLSSICWVYIQLKIRDNTLTSPLSLYLREKPIQTTNPIFFF